MVQINHHDLRTVLRTCSDVGASGGFSKYSRESRSWSLPKFIDPVFSSDFNEQFPLTNSDPEITITQTPTDASFVTLSDFSITTPTIITTTKAGSNDQEIVPVILVKPKKKNPTNPDPVPVPVVCFGCFPGIQFPPKIKVTLKLPDICIQILWFKIGSCPSGEDKKGGGGGGSDGNNDDKPDDEPDDEPDDPESTRKSTERTSSTSSSSSSSSCTVTATATHQTVYCSATQGNTSLLTTAQTTCLSSTYTTITGCSVTNAATTVTATVAGTQIPYYPPCSPQICGDGVCRSTPNRALSREKEKRGNPAQGEWVDPDDYPNGYAEFMPAQLREARSRPGGEGFAPKLLKQGPGPARGPYPLFNDTDEGEEAAQEYYYSELPVSTEFLIFEDEVQSLAIDRMVGCDAIILVSRLGAFVCHFYEGSWNSDRNIDDLMRICYYGRPEDDPMHEWAQYGIDNVRDHPEEGKRGIILGDQDPDAEEDDFEDIIAFVITPRVRPNIWIIDRDGPRIRPDEEILAPDIMAGSLRYATDRVNRVKKILTGIFVDVPINTIDYPPAMLPYAEWSRLEALEDTFAFAEALQDSIFDTPRGKILLQYKPAPSCDQEVEVRLFVDVLGVFQNFLALFKVFLGHVEIVQDHLEANLVDRDTPPLRDIHRSANIKDPVSNQQRTRDPGVPAPSKFKTSLHRTAVTTARTLDRLPATLPLESVQIYLKEWTSGEGGAVGWIPFWEMFAVPIYSDFNVCKATKVGDDVQSWFRRSEQGEDGRPPSFKADKDIFGKKNCKYKDDGSEDVVGWLSCDGVPEFKCRRSKQLKVECDDMDIKVFRARVECVFPVN
ncbi:hypothetical protein GCG54_00011068 [Colletotrichum gloeosporioides]|uniref:Uncharacterized protein n=1 Tax=Colletotrichum gloeosporioides TaxID=474922 RepID=A0A8H4FNQ2_COLGL|nr:uncharacterized protein GCG54_00011068 [Colletotrichum gloeosporioides]KAF3808877.1 hypothetical protein GCG54_00011068 [Colletotrichum gloeosporioides]